jgi:hypothetical protein
VVLASVAPGSTRVKTWIVGRDLGSSLTICFTKAQAEVADIERDVILRISAYCHDALRACAHDGLLTLPHCTRDLLLVSAYVVHAWRRDKFLYVHRISGHCRNFAIPVP